MKTFSAEKWSDLFTAVGPGTYRKIGDEVEELVAENTDGSVTVGDDIVSEITARADWLGQEEDESGIDGDGVANALVAFADELEKSM